MDYMTMTNIQPDVDRMDYALYGVRMDYTNESLEEFIRVELGRPGRSESWLSSSTGIARVTLRRRLASPDQFTLDELVKVARALGVDPSELATRYTRKALAA